MKIILACFLWVSRGCALAAVLTSPVFAQPSAVVAGPVGSEQFGQTLTVLPNGNFVVADPLWDKDSTADVGAVYLYEGCTRTLLSTLTGAAAHDRVGSGGVVVLANGHYVVSSPDWANGPAAKAGAATWCHGTQGLRGPVTAGNSLVGSQPDDQVSLQGIAALINGHYVVSSPHWAKGPVAQAGAATWGHGVIGISGLVTAGNSLVGTAPHDQVSSAGTTALTNGHYVVSSLHWGAGTPHTGAVTWGHGGKGTVGAVSAANSFVGLNTADNGELLPITALTNGHYVVNNPRWANGAAADAGAVTWGNGRRGSRGVISAANSLVGTTAEDMVGFRSVTALVNGHYVVSSPTWANGAVENAGAVTWGNGRRGTRGAVSAANSLVGTTAHDQVGDQGVTALATGHYVASSPDWTAGEVEHAGAATWGHGRRGIRGAVTAANSLVGAQAGDRVSSAGVTALINGHYVASSPEWANGPVARAGAATWAPGDKGLCGPVSVANSLVGSLPEDQVSDGGVTALTNGHYVVRSGFWDRGPIADAGAVTWGPGQGGRHGPVGAANSLVGASTKDNVGFFQVTALTNGDYVVSNPLFDTPAVYDAGAATWADGSTGLSGPVSSANSLVGTRSEDRVSSGGVKALPNGRYAVISDMFRDSEGKAFGPGAVAWSAGTRGAEQPDTQRSKALLTGRLGTDFFYQPTTGALLFTPPDANKVIFFWPPAGSPVPCP